MSDRMATRHAICALSDAGRSNKEILRILNVAKTTVIRTLKKAAGGGLEHDTTRRKKTVLTPRVAAGLKRRIKAAPTKSLRRVAKEAGLKPGVVWKLVRDEGSRSLRRKKVPLISSAGRKKRAARAAGLINALKRGDIQAGYCSFQMKKPSWSTPLLTLKTIDLPAFTTRFYDGDRRRSGRYMARASIRPAPCFLELWPPLERPLLQFGSLRGLD